MATQIDYTRVTPNIDIQAARNGIEIDVSKRGLRGPRGEQGPGVGETVASITSGRGFWPLRKALAAGTARVVAMGDSKTEGAGVETVDQRWLDQLMGTLRARYAPDGDQGLGYLPAYYATFYGFPSAPTTSGSAVTVGNGGGLGNRSRHLQAGGSVTWTVPAWTSGVPLLVHWTQHPGLGDLEVVTSGTVRGTIVTGGSPIESKVTAVTIPAGTTSITVRHKSGTGTGNAARVEGIVHRTATTGVTIYDGARSGAKLVDYAQGLVNDGAPLSDDWHFQAVAAVQPHAVILAFGANDQASRTPAQWGTDLRTVVDKAKAAAPGAGIIVLHGAQRTEDVTADPMRVLRFEAAARDAVGADPDVTILYESTLWKPTAGVDYTSSDPSGWLADTVHTGPAANAQIARYLAAQVTGADAATDAVEVASEAIKPAVTAAEAAKTQAQSAATSSQASVTLAQQAQAAALEVPDANVSALIGNDVTETAKALTESTLGLAQRTDYVEVGRRFSPYRTMELRKVPNPYGGVNADPALEVSCIAPDGRHVTYTVGSIVPASYQIVSDIWEGETVTAEGSYTVTAALAELSGTWNTSATYYTTQVGAYVEAPAPFTVAGGTLTIGMRTFADNRGGIWRLSLVEYPTAGTHDVSVWNETGTYVDKPAEWVVTGLPAGDYTVRATFQGDDPAHVPSSGAGTARGWLAPASNPAAIITMNAVTTTLSKDNPIKTGYSNPDYAVQTRPTPGDTYRFLPDHNQGQDVENGVIAPTYYDGASPIDVAGMDVGDKITLTHSFEIVQRINGRNTTTGPDTLAAATKQRITPDGTHSVEGSIKVLTDVQVHANSYFLMHIVNPATLDRLVSSWGNEYDLTFTTEAITNLTVEKNRATSWAAVSSTDDGLFSAVRFNDPNASMRVADSVASDPVWVHHRSATLAKLYPRLGYATDTLVPAGTVWRFSGDYWHGRLPGIAHTVAP